MYSVGFTDNPTIAGELFFVKVKLIYLYDSNVYTLEFHPDSPDKRSIELDSFNRTTFSLLSLCDTRVNVPLLSPCMPVAPVAPSFPV